MCEGRTEGEREAEGERERERQNRLTVQGGPGVASKWQGTFNKKAGTV